MLKQAESKDFPAYLDLDVTQFRRTKKDWLLWRMCGHTDANGNFDPDIPAFIMARRDIPKDELEMYFELDRLIAIRLKQTQEKKPQ